MAHTCPNKSRTAEAVYDDSGPYKEVTCSECDWTAIVASGQEYQLTFEEHTV